MNNLRVRRISTNTLLALAFAAFLWTVTGCGGRTPQQLATIEAESTLTAAHESEVRSIIETLYMMSGSLDAQRNRSSLSLVLTGPELATQVAVGSVEPGSELYVTRLVELNEIHVLEYTSSRIKVIGCGRFYDDRVTYEGQVIRTLQPLTFMNILVFVQEDGKWKLFAGYSFLNRDDALRDWESESEEERQAIGDLRSYMDLYPGCGLNLN